MATRSTPRLLTTKNSWSTSESIDLLNAVKGHLAQHPSDAFDFIYKDDAISALYCARSIPRSIGEIAVHLTQIKTDMAKTGTNVVCSEVRRAWIKSGLREVQTAMVSKRSKDDGKFDTGKARDAPIVRPSWTTPESIRLLSGIKSYLVENPSEAVDFATNDHAIRGVLWDNEHHRSVSEIAVKLYSTNCMMMQPSWRPRSSELRDAWAKSGLLGTQKLCVSEHTKVGEKTVEAVGEAKVHHDEPAHPFLEDFGERVEEVLKRTAKKRRSPSEIDSPSPTKKANTCRAGGEIVEKVDVGACEKEIRVDLEATECARQERNESKRCEEKEMMTTTSDSPSVGLDAWRQVVDRRVAQLAASMERMAKVLFNLQALPNNCNFFEH